jgi:hypothetical protein
LEGSGVIGFINSAFSVGKTAVATLLAKRSANSLLYDPEEVGFLVRNVLRPIELNDCQVYRHRRSIHVGLLSLDR